MADDIRHCRLQPRLQASPPANSTGMAICRAMHVVAFISQIGLAWTTAFAATLSFL
jgi:hypothetical protein